MSCSSHSPPLSQIGQSSGWLASSMSSMKARVSTTRGELVCTTMPSATAIAQEGWSLPCPSISTRHMRHEASTGSRFW